MFRSKTHPLDSKGRSMPSRKTSTILVALLVTALLPAAAQAEKTVRGYGFKTKVPSGWNVKKSTSSGWRSVLISAPGTRTSVTRGSNYLSIGSIPAKALAKRAGGPLPNSLVEMVELVAAIPTAAVNVNLSAAPGPTTLGGKAAGSGAYTYVFDGAQLVQTEVVTRHAGRIYVIQMTADASLSIIGASASNMARANWRWR
jgi:hypothetical protein